MVSLVAPKVGRCEASCLAMNVSDSAGGGQRDNVHRAIRRYYAVRRRSHIHRAGLFPTRKDRWPPCTGRRVPKFTTCHNRDMPREVVIGNVCLCADRWRIRIRLARGRRDILRRPPRRARRPNGVVKKYQWRSGVVEPNQVEVGRIEGNLNRDVRRGRQIVHIICSKWGRRATICYVNPVDGPNENGRHVVTILRCRGHRN